MAEELKTAKIEVDGRELQTLYTALDELPGKMSRVLYGKISNQVQAQLNAFHESQKQAAQT